MKALVEAEVNLQEPTAANGLVTWFQVRVVDARSNQETGHCAVARVARIHVGMAAEVGESLKKVLEADSAQLLALYEEFFEDDWFSEQFTEGAGTDLLYISEIAVKPSWSDRKLSQALMRRLCDTLGQGCELAVIAYSAGQNVADWQRMGFAGVVDENVPGFLHLPLATRQVRLDSRGPAGEFTMVDS